MGKQGFFERALVVLKKWVGPKTWLFALGTRNLFPKIGTAIAVYRVTSILLNGLLDATPSNVKLSASAAEVTTKEALRLAKMLDVMNSKTLLVALVALNIVWMLALLARGAFKFWKIKSPGLFKFGQFGPLVGIAAQFLMGMLLVPMVITGTMMVIIPGEFSSMDQYTYWVTAVGFVGIVIAMDYFAFIEKELPNAVIYTMATGSKMAFPVGPKIVEIVDRAMSGLTWIGSADFHSASEDGRVVVSLPVLYAAANWSNDEASQLGTRLHAAEQDLLHQGCTTLYRLVPEKIEAKMPLPLRNPYQPAKAKSGVTS